VFLLAGIPCACSAEKDTISRDHSIQHEMFLYRTLLILIPRNVIDFPPPRRGFPNYRGTPLPPHLLPNDSNPVFFSFVFFRREGRVFSEKIVESAFPPPPPQHFLLFLYRRAPFPPVLPSACKIRLPQGTVCFNRCYIFNPPPPVVDDRLVDGMWGGFLLCETLFPFPFAAASCTRRIANRR